VAMIPKGIGGLVGLIPAMLKHGQLTVSLLGDRRVPILSKAALAVLFLLILSPLDIPNFVPVLGEITDAFFVLLAMQVFLHICPRDVLDEHIDRLGLRGKVKLLFFGR
jgi:uncharacterized membrane protein YkvA (DUF1232 family)